MGGSICIGIIVWKGDGIVGGIKRNSDGWIPYLAHYRRFLHLEAVTWPETLVVQDRSAPTIVTEDIWCQVGVVGDLPIGVVLPWEAVVNLGVEEVVRAIKNILCTKKKNPFSLKRFLQCSEQNLKHCSNTDRRWFKNYSIWFTFHKCFREG